MRINLPNFVQYSNIDILDNTKALRRSGPSGAKPSPPEAESIWPQSSDNPKHSEQTVMTAMTKTTQCYVEIVTVILDIIGHSVPQTIHKVTHAWKSSNVTAQGRPPSPPGSLDAMHSLSFLLPSPFCPSPFNRVHGYHPRENFGIKDACIYRVVQKNWHPLFFTAFSTRRVL